MLSLNYCIIIFTATANQCSPALVNLQYSRYQTLKCQQNPSEQAIRGWAASRNAQWEIVNDGRESEERCCLIISLYKLSIANLKTKP